MDALFEEQFRGVVEDASDHVSADDSLEELVAHHEKDALSEAEKILEQIGGKVRGHHVKHDNGATIEESQFEVIKNVSEI